MSLNVSRCLVNQNTVILIKLNKYPLRTGYSLVIKKKFEMKLLIAVIAFSILAIFGCDWGLDGGKPKEVDSIIRLTVGVENQKWFKRNK